MRPSVLRLLIAIGTIVALPVVGYTQQQATLTGTVTDTTGGVLPGVTVVAVHEASGNTFEAVTDERGAYRIPARTGVYRLTAELAGFATLNRTGLELLLGQQAVVNLQLSPSGVQESVTVTGETPLIDVTQSRISGNIDTRQTQELPLNGRNWLDLTLLAPGSRGNALSNDDPVPGASSQGYFQINVDGQQVTQLNQTGFGQPGFSRDAIAEFEFVANRFDATQGRSGQVQVNAITKSGTNTFSGSLSGYFRDDRFNAADFIQKRVIPYSDQQVSGTFGGPIRKDKVHFFANYEYEREPQTYTYNSPYPRFNIDLAGTRRERKGGVRLDARFSSQTGLAVRANTWRNLIPYDSRFAGGASLNPAGANFSHRFSDELFATVTQILSNRAVNEVKGGYTSYRWIIDSYTSWPDSPTASAVGAPAGRGIPNIQLRGYTFGSTVHPQYYGVQNYSVRDDFTFSFNKGGRHDLKLGGEFLNQLGHHRLCNLCMGSIDATGGPVPANIEDLFPNLFDVTTWNLAALSPITVRYRRGVGNFRFYLPQHKSAAWVQDDWAVTRRLTLNLGVRYDLETGLFAEKLGVPPFLPPNRRADTNNIAPRLGSAFALTDRTVIRGGFGLFFTDIFTSAAQRTAMAALVIVPETPNDGRPDFAANPYNGPPPTFDEVMAKACTTANVPGCVRREASFSFWSPNTKVPYSYQASVGVQRQLGNTMAFEADYVYTGTRLDNFVRNINLSYNPATGVNYPFSDVSRRPHPEWGLVPLIVQEGRSNYHGLQTTFKKRLSGRWQATGTYALAALRDGYTSPVPFELAPDLGGAYTLSANDQRHRVVFNGIGQLGYGFQLSGLYFFGSGMRFGTSYGGDLRNTGGGGSTPGTGRLRPNGTIVPRNNLVGEPIHRVDVRIQRRFKLVGRAGVDGIFEVFNLFNHENYGSYTTFESNARYGKPTFNNNVAYQPRVLQLGFRLSF